MQISNISKFTWHIYLLKWIIKYKDNTMEKIHVFSQQQSFYYGMVFIYIQLPWKCQIFSVFISQVLKDMCVLCCTFYLFIYLFKAVCGKAVTNSCTVKSEGNLWTADFESDLTSKCFYGPPWELLHLMRIWGRI